MGDVLRTRAATAEAAEPDKQSPASLASLSQGWRTDVLPFEQRPIYQFVLLEGYQEHSGRTWHRRFAGTAMPVGAGGRFGYRASDIDRIQNDGDMIVVERVVGWMPATWPSWNFDATKEY